MKKLTLLITLLLALSVTPAMANTSQSNIDDGKNYTFSVGSYARTFANDYTDESFIGYALSGTAVFAEFEHFDFASHATLSFLENENMSSFESSGAEVNVLLGQNLTQVGFKWYAGVGFFSESWELTGSSSDFSGAQVAGGVGYNTKNVTFDLYLNVRPKSAYEDISGLDSVTSAMFSIGLRF